MYLKLYLWYKRLVIEGVRQHNLPEKYINQLNQFEATENSNSRGNKENRSINCDPVKLIMGIP